MNTSRARHIAIIGSGFSGICLGIQLKKAGIDSFTIFEKADRVGGTWRDNTYPGACCDVPSMSYCFSFEQKTDWSRKWAPQSEILEYMEHCVRKYGLERHIRFGTAIDSAAYDALEGVWNIRTSGGEDFVADVLVSGVGQLHRPHIPEFEGRERFRGEQFHSARWRHDVDLTDQRVAVVGNAASAIQFIPQIAREVKDLSIFQRSPNWMIPRGDRSYTENEKTRFARIPLLARLYRFWMWLRLELLFYPIVRRNPKLSKRLEQFAVECLNQQVRDPELREKLIPDYPVAGKRILISDDYYPTLNQPNVHLITDGIDHFTEDGIVTADGATHPADVVVFATGFESTAFLAPMKIHGRDGQSLHDTWRDGAEAYLGMTSPGFPNLFMMYGPNTNLGHNSILFMIECQTGYIMRCIRELFDHNLKSIEPRAEEMAEFNREVREGLAGTAWAATGKSWYKNTAGRITNNWPRSTVLYWWRTRRTDFERYVLEPRVAYGPENSRQAPAKSPQRAA